MGVKIQPVNTTHLIIGLAAIGLAFFVYREAKQTAKKVGQAVNPVNPENVFYSAVNDVGSAVTGEEEFSLGIWIYEKLHPNESEKLGL